MPQLDYPRLRAAARLAGDRLRGPLPGDVAARGAARSPDTLAKRQAKIQGDLDAAEKANEETRALVAAYEKRLADAREDARRLHARARRGRQRRGGGAAQRACTIALAKQIDEAEKRIAAQRDDVMAGLEHMARTSARTSMPSSPASRPTRRALAGKVATAIKGGSR